MYVDKITISLIKSIVNLKLIYIAGFPRCFHFSRKYPDNQRAESRRMQNQGYLQQLKEQVKVKSLELKKSKLESGKTSEKLRALIENSQSEIKALKAVIKEKDEKISLQRLERLASQDATAQAETNGSIEGSKKETTADEEGQSQNDSSLNLDLQKNLELLKNQARLLKEQMTREKQRNEHIRKENEILDKKLKRLQKNSGNSKILLDKVQWLQSQLKQARASILNYKQVAQKILRKKDLMLEKYEAFLYGGDIPVKKGTSPAVIIKELKAEVDDLAIENKSLTNDMEFLQRENDELESKILLAEENEIVDAQEFKPNSETRVAVTTEFSNGLESFLVTYSDMITLILVIFVLLYSVSKVDSGKFTEVFSSIQDKDILLTHRNVRLDPKEFEMLKRVRELVKDNVDPESLVRSDVRTILIRLKSADLFAPGSADLKEGAEDLILNSINSEIQDGVKQIQVDGHTDNVPMAGKGQFPTNWELSSVRASHVARVIIDKARISPDRMVVTGYGEYRPFKPNNSDENRDLNRRVEIKILKDKKIPGSETEKSPKKFNGQSPINKNLLQP